MVIITIPNVVLNLNPASINSNSPIFTTGSVVNLSVNGTFQVSGSGKVLGYYNNNFPLTASADLSSSISNIDTLAVAKVNADLGV